MSKRIKERMEERNDQNPFDLSHVIRISTMADLQVRWAAQLFASRRHRTPTNNPPDLTPCPTRAENSGEKSCPHLTRRAVVGIRT